MAFSIKNPVTCILTAMACVVLCTATVSADIHTFWKTSVCPNFGGLKIPIAFEQGVMQATAVDLNADNLADTVGGPFCDLASDLDTTAPLPLDHKVLTAFNADVLKNPTGDDPAGPGIPGDPWECVVCQYENKVIIQAIPVLSLLGTAILFVGLGTAVLYELRKRRAAA